MGWGNVLAAVDREISAVDDDQEASETPWDEQRNSDGCEDPLEGFQTPSEWKCRDRIREGPLSPLSPLRTAEPTSPMRLARTKGERSGQQIDAWPIMRAVLTAASTRQSHALDQLQATGDAIDVSKQSLADASVSGDMEGFLKAQLFLTAQQQHQELIESALENFADTATTVQLNCNRLQAAAAAANNELMMRIQQAIVRAEVDMQQLADEIKSSQQLQDTVRQTERALAVAERAADDGVVWMIKETLGAAEAKLMAQVEQLNLAAEEGEGLHVASSPTNCPYVLLEENLQLVDSVNEVTDSEEEAGVQLLLDGRQWADWVQKPTRPSSCKMYSSSGHIAAGEIDSVVNTMRYDCGVGQVKVFVDVVKGRNLGASNSACFIKLNCQARKYKSRSIVVADGEKWWLVPSQRFDLVVDAPKSAPITIEVFESLDMKLGGSIGKTQVQLRSLKQGVRYAGWIPLRSDQESDAQIMIRCGLSCSSDPGERLASHGTVGAAVESVPELEAIIAGALGENTSVAAEAAHAVVQRARERSIVAPAVKPSALQLPVPGHTSSSLSPTPRTRYNVVGESNGTGSVPRWLSPPPLRSPLSPQSPLGGYNTPLSPQSPAMRRFAAVEDAAEDENGSVLNL